MARYGYGYSVDGLIAGIQKGLEEAIEPTANEMLEEIVDIIDQDIYEAYSPNKYIRTNEILHSVSYDIIGTYIIFKFGRIYTIDTIHHHFLDQGYDVLGMIEEVAGNKFHNHQIMDDIRAGVLNRQHFMKVYQKYCRQYGIKFE
jgi:hypothetical protein